MLLAPPLAESPRDALRVLVSDDPQASPHLAVTPAHAARLITAGLAAGVVVDDGDDARQWLHIVATGVAR